MGMTGGNEMRAKLRAFRTKFPQMVVSALRVEAEIEATECKKRTPVWTGKTGPGYPIPGLLRASIHVEGPFIAGSHIYASIVAGGAAGAYAIYVHEDLTAFHPIGQSKFIESVIFESRPYMAARVAARLDISKMVI